MEEFKGEASEAIANLKTKVDKIEGQLEGIDKRIWIMMLLLIIVLLVKAPDFANEAIKSVLAFGK